MTTSFLSMLTRLMATAFSRRKNGGGSTSGKRLVVRLKKPKLNCLILPQTYGARLTKNKNAIFHHQGSLAEALSK